MPSHDHFLRYRNLLTQACVAYHSDSPISWDVSASKMSAAYVRSQLRETMKAYVLNPKWHDESIPFNTVRDILTNWSIRDNGGYVEVGPRKPPFRNQVLAEQQTSRELTSTNAVPQIVIDGTNRSFVSAIALLKNHDQITPPVLLTDFDTSFLESLYTSFPNIEIIQDTIAGSLSPNYILI